MALSHREEHDGRVRRVTFDNAARGNSFDDASLAGLAEAIEAAGASANCDLVRLEMVGAHFCGGWDTTSFSGLAAASADEVADALRRSDDSLARIRNSTVPIVAGVRGKVIGFGAGLLDAIHLPIAADDASLMLPEARFGFAPAGVGHVIAQRLPRPHAYRLLTGMESLDSRELYDAGLVAAVCAPEELDAEVDRHVATLLALPAGTLRGVCEVIESSRATGLPDQAFAASARSIVARAGALR